MHSCHILSDLYWPHWPADALNLVAHRIQSKLPRSSEASNLLADGAKQCFVNYPCGLLTFSDGEETPSWEPCGGLWSHISPGGSLITTLLAKVPEDYEDFSTGSHCQRSAHAFQHLCTTTAKEVSVPLSTEDGTGSSSELQTKSHPFLCAWLPGTAIYAAGALGYVYVVDGMRDQLLKMWPANAFEMGEDDSPTRDRYPRTGGPEFVGLSWSPDGLHLAWLHEDMQLRIVSFAAD